MLQGDARRNIVITSFGFAAEGTFDLNITQFAVPDAISHLADSSEQADKTVSEKDSSVRASIS